MQICESRKCTGCSACQNICPENCISMTEQTLGHIFPVIDESRCIGCGACSRVCPQNNPPAFHSPLLIFAAHSKDSLEHAASTSGGVAAVFSRKFLEGGGIVYGCSSSLEDEIKHIDVTKANIDDLNLLRGSKYVQSHMGDILSDVLYCLKTGKIVLFFGTPCQIAGLLNFIGKPHESLVTVELLCHGVPSQKLLFEHLEENGITKGELISFREKSGSVLRVKKGSQTIYKKSAAKDNYYRAFHKNLTLRESCHSCDFAKSERCADITIGDFWGLGSDAPISRKNGVSLVLINTQKGKTFWEAYCQEFSFAERSLEEAVAGNHPLKFPAPRPKEREQFIKLYEQLGFNAAIKSVLPQQSSFSLLRRIARKIKHLLKR